eukprot:Sdes_comp19026_c0_seq1m9585
MKQISSQGTSKILAGKKNGGNFLNLNLKRNEQEKQEKEEIYEKSIFSFLELEKKLNEKNDLSIQYEAILDYPNFLDANPFSEIVNSSLLKFVEIFIQAKNPSIRFILVKTFQQLSKKGHLLKLKNLDDILNRFFIVTQSNDQIARILTLKIFECFSFVAAENPSIHHFIHASLFSTHKMEIFSSISAAKLFCKQSKSFAFQTFEILKILIHRFDISLDTKFQLIPLFSHFGKLSLE